MTASKRLPGAQCILQLHTHKQQDSACTPHDFLPQSPAVLRYARPDATVVTAVHDPSSTMLSWLGHPSAGEARQLAMSTICSTVLALLMSRGCIRAATGVSAPLWGLLPLVPGLWAAI